MGKKINFGRVSEKQQKHYERMARLQYGPEIVNDSIKRWNSYTKDEQEAIFAQGGEIYSGLVQALENGLSSQDTQVQALLQRWHEHLANFYEPTLEILRGLGELYSTDPAFMAFFEKLHPQLPEYLAQGIAKYVDDLETEEIERLLAEDDLKSRSSRLSYQQKAL